MVSMAAGLEEASIKVVKHDQGEVRAAGSNDVADVADVASSTAEEADIKLSWL